MSTHNIWRFKIEISYFHLSNFFSFKTISGEDFNVILLDLHTFSQNNSQHWGFICKWKREKFFFFLLCMTGCCICWRTCCCCCGRGWAEIVDIDWTEETIPAAWALQRYRKVMFYNSISQKDPISLQNIDKTKWFNTPHPLSK